MNKKLFLIPIVAFGLLASCNNSTPNKHHFNVGCVNCTANLENSLSIDVNENEYATFDLLPNENYLLPVDIKVTSGNLVLTKNIDYIYSLSDDRLTGKVMIKSIDATDIYIEADEQGYLYIGNNKISKSGDYSRLDDTQISSLTVKDTIVYDYKTNTLTLFDAHISYESVGTHDFDFVNDFGYEEFDSDKISGLIGWTGGGNFTLRLLGENFFTSEGVDNLESVIVAPLTNAELNIVGPGSANFSKAKHSIILNQRGKTFINDVYINADSLNFSGIHSKETFASNSHICLNGSKNDMESYGIYTNYSTFNKTYIEVNNFGFGITNQRLSLIDSDIKMSEVYEGIETALVNVDGYKIGEKYSCNIDIDAIYSGISSKNSILLNGAYVDCTVEQGYCIITPNTTIEANDCYINATSLSEGVGFNAFQIFLTNCNVFVNAKIAMFSSLNGDQEEGREFEPNIEIDNTTIKAIGEIYGNGHFKATNCIDDQSYKYLEKEVDPDHGQYLWALCPYSETELKYEVEIIDDQPYYYPTNALDHVSIYAKNNTIPEQRQTVVHICDLEKTARLGLGKEVKDKTSYQDYERELAILDLHFRKTFGDSSDQIQLEYSVILFHRYLAVPTFTIVIIDKDGNEIGAFRNHYGCGEGIGRVTFTRDYCVRGNELAIHSFIEDYKDTGLQNYQVYVESIIFD